MYTDKSEKIRSGLQKGFQDGTSKMAKRKCYGYDTAKDGELTINQGEAEVVRWIFDQYLNGMSSGKIVAELSKRGITSPTGKPKWNREAIDKLLSNEKYTGRVLLQKTVSFCDIQIRNDGFAAKYLYENAHDPIISDEMFQEVQRKKLQRSKNSGR